MSRLKTGAAFLAFSKLLLGKGVGCKVMGAWTTAVEVTPSLPSPTTYIKYPVMRTIHQWKSGLSSRNTITLKLLFISDFKMEMGH